MTNTTQAQHGRGEGASGHTIDRTIDRAFAAMSREPTVAVRTKVLSRLDDHAAAGNRTSRMAGWRTWGLAGAGVVGAVVLAIVVLWSPSRPHVSHSETDAIVSSRAGKADSETGRSPAMPAAGTPPAAGAERIRAAVEGPRRAASARPRARRLPEPVFNAPSGATALIDDPLFLAARLPDVEPISVDPILLTPIEAAPLSEPPIVVPPLVLPPVGAHPVPPPDAPPGRGASSEPTSSPVPEGDRR
jgi:hypothetical protein